MVRASRLKQLRKARGMTAVALAREVGVSAASITAYENGTAEPRMSTITDICRVLKAHPDYFTRDPIIFGGQPRFRSSASATKRERERAESIAESLREMVWLLEERYVDFPPLALLELDVPDPRNLSDQRIEEVALDVRKLMGFGMGPIVNVIDAIESHGVIAARFDFQSDDLDGFSIFGERGRPVILLNTTRKERFLSCARMRFGAAHELGHLVMHRYAPANPGKDLYDLMEKQAHRFASAFLFPTSIFEREVRSMNPDHLVAFKLRWGISVGALLAKGSSLPHGRFSKAEISRAWKIMSARGWRLEEPFDRETPAEEPSVLRSAYTTIINERRATRAELLGLLPLSSEDHEQLAGLPEGFMSQEQKPIVKLKAAQEASG